MPPRKKQRADGVLVAVPDQLEDKVDQAYWMRNDKHMSWDEIAVALEYASPAAARVAVHQYIQTCAVQVTARRRQAVLNHELALFDTIEAVLMPRVLDGDLKAIDGIMRASMNRAKLEGLFEIEHEKEGMRTVVVSVERYAETMKAIALEGTGETA